jgi:hypothetical protein
MAPLNCAYFLILASDRTLRMARSAMDSCPGLVLTPEVSGGAKNSPNVKEGGAKNPVDVGGGASNPPVPVRTFVFALVDRDTDPGLLRMDTALVDTPRMRTELVLLALTLALTRVWGCESKRPESNELKHARVSCVCVRVIVVDNLNVDAKRPGVRFSSMYIFHSCNEKKRKIHE